MLSDMEYWVYLISLWLGVWNSLIHDSDYIRCSGSFLPMVLGCALMNPTGLERIRSQLPLGRLSEQPEFYDPSVLVGVPRTLARGVEVLMLLNLRDMISGIVGKSRGLILKGKPITRIGQLIVPANSPNLCESKSLKLYLNSFANEKIESEAALITRVSDDLETVLGVRPKFCLYALDDNRFVVENPKGVCIDGLPVDLAVYEPDATFTN